MNKLLKQITDRRILYFSTVCALFLVQIIKQTSFYLQNVGIINDYDSIKSVYVLFVCIPFLLFLYIKNLIKLDRDLDIYDYIFFALAVGGIVVSLFSIDMKISFLGKEYRHEGYLALLTYYLLFINWKTLGKKEDVNKVINLVTIVGAVNAIYAIMQVYFDFKFILWFTPLKQMATGFCGNPNFFGSLMVTVLSLITSRFLINKDIKKMDILLIILFFFSLINCQSLGPFLAYVVTLIFLLIYIFVKKKHILKNILYLMIILSSVYAFTNVLNNNILHFERCEMCNFIKAISNTKTQNVAVGEEGISINGYNLDSGRMDIWKNTFKIAQKNLINGVGYDNLYLAYYEGHDLNEVVFVTDERGQIKAVRRFTSIVDNAHNVYLHTFASSGLIGLLPYLLLCLLTFIKALKTKNDLIIILLGGFVAYSIQAFANLSVIQIAPIYYIIIGLILALKEPQKRKTKKRKKA